MNIKFQKSLIRRFHLGIILVILILPIIAQANDHNPGVFPVNSKPYGLTHGEWSAKWWQWVYSIPLPENPLIDDNGSNAANGQGGPVWFLAGKFCLITCEIATANREVNIPEGKAILFPILNVEWDNFNGTTGGSDNFTVEELRNIAKSIMDTGSNMTAEVDGVPITDLDSALTTRYRVISPVFTYSIPNNSLLTPRSAGDVPPPGAVDDGVYIMLKPLTVGRHKIHFAGDFSPNVFALDINYTVNIIPSKDKN